MDADCPFSIVICHLLSVMIREQAMLRYISAESFGFP
jgi:hypothetical protein